jgi:hypothetical protein
MVKLSLGWVYCVGETSGGSGVGAKTTAPPVQPASNPANNKIR